MRKASLLILASVALGALTLTSLAGAYNSPKQAKKQFIEFVTAYNPCTAPSLTHRPNLANPACQPVESTTVTPTNVMTFGQKNGKDDGSMSLTFQASKGDIRIAVKSKSVWNNGAPFSGTIIASWIVRQTDNGCGDSPYNVDCTQVDWPLPIALACTSGSCQSNAPSWQAIVPEIYHAGDKTNTQLGSITVRDPDGDNAFTGGLFVQ